MPYILQEQRDYLATGRGARDAGEVNYLTTLLMNAYLTNYDSANEIATHIEGAIFDLHTKDLYNAEATSSFSMDLAGIVNSADVARTEVIGALRNAHLEFYILKVRPYEDIKKKENGDV